MLQTIRLIYVFALSAIFSSFNLYAQTTASNGEHDWYELGVCPFTNNIIASAEPQSYDITVEADAANDGLFRITDIWKDYPEKIKQRLVAEGFTFYSGSEYYIIFDTRNPQYVRILPSPLGLSDRDGDYTVCTPSEIIGQYIGIDDAYAADKAGKFYDGIISFSEPSAIFLRQNNWFTRTNLQGATTLDLSEFIAGINDIITDDHSRTQYFNTLGIPVANPGKGIYICRKGNKTIKILKR